MRLRDLPGLVAIAGYGTGIVLMFSNQGKAALIVWAVAIVVHWLDTPITEYLTYSNPLARRQRAAEAAREAKDRDIWERATEWERGRMERESQAAARSYIAQLKQDNSRTRPDYERD